MKNQILLIDKPKGITSHDVVDEVRCITGERKVGHAGTLDPMATGLLIVLVGRDATKKQREFMGMEKEYIAEITFGLETNTYDAEGELANRVPLSAVRDLKEENVKDALKRFKGIIDQQVPPYSAVKIDGKPLYKYAREGRLDEVELPTREVKIKEIELLGFEKGSHSESSDLSDGEVSPAEGNVPFVGGDSSVATLFQNDSKILSSLPKAKIRVVCSKGTYIRSLAHDLGQKLGTGSFLSALRRTKIGEYSIDDTLSLGDLRQEKS